jgi:hypothetical protein
MEIVKRLSLLLVAGAVLLSQQAPSDPVQKARMLRAQAQGINESDLPPVPKGVTEPPPLPPPEIHAKDAKGGGRPSKVAGRKAGRKGKEARVKGKEARVKGKARGKVKEAPESRKVIAKNRRAPGKKAGKGRKGKA